jgi:hypothetical protein
MTKAIINRYTLCHPLITPEFFGALYDPMDLNSQVKVKSLAVYEDLNKPPDLIYDSPDQALMHVFGNMPDTIDIIRIHPNFHMYISILDLLNQKSENVIATYLYRLCGSSLFGRLIRKSIRGPVLLFSSVSASTGQSDGKDYSVPYELLEQVIRISNLYAQQS